MNTKHYLTKYILSSPLEILFTLLVFMVNASPLQLMIMTSIKPLSSLFAFYLSSFTFNRSENIKPYLNLIYLAGTLPCFFYPFVDNTWYFVGSYALFMICIRAVYPVWIELIRNDTHLNKTISYATSIYYTTSMLFPVVACYFMDIYPNLWRYLFPCLALLQLSTLLLIPTLKIPKPTLKEAPSLMKCLKLLKEKPWVLNYQILFLLGGAGIVMSQSVLPTFFKENLKISYTQLGLAFSFCKGISFVLASPIWAKWSKKISIYHLNTFVNLFTCLFFTFVIAATSNIFWIYVAYLFYGTMQAGCEISWNLSGPIFSEKEESTIYSSLNLCFVGFRGCFCPLLGYLLFAATNSVTVFAASMCITLLSVVYGWMMTRTYQLRFNL